MSDVARASLPVAILLLVLTGSRARRAVGAARRPAPRASRASTSSR